ncbi:MazG nucleotide pyrophosphohydrolase domain-containing protein [Nocardiopsis composta]|uniref:NTP pyrophosphatase (Non-canonical NTP hydrolase) n=1 Tax=Nocardiopsis composta TaxID=157465 RepID=A0A7W8QH85_9ACTN|nr:MazG nucleotide pyrophosphohydrolase domain-containing protein [Nocardiopsis composta]MBB5429989.1 NTP pyrophosphatase (non-canonical NTP hydrolase) [Nocardiopsis composta]
MPNPDTPTPEVVAELFARMGIDDQGPRECIAFLAEEVGELAKATRTGDLPGVAEEIGDVGILLHRIALLHGIDLDEAVRAKADLRRARYDAEHAEG